MMKHEFEQLAGYEVSWTDYNTIIEPMYMACPDSITKADFVSMIDKKRFALKTEKQLLREMKKLAGELAETCEHFTDFEKENRIEALCREYASRFAHGAWLVRKHTGPNYRGCTFPGTIYIPDRDEQYVMRKIELVKAWYE